MTATQIDFTKLGQDARVSADDAHEGDTPSVSLAYSFVLDNPECFMGSTDVNDQWPEDMPTEAPLAFIEGYYYSA